MKKELEEKLKEYEHASRDVLRTEVMCLVTD